MTSTQPKLIKLSVVIPVYNEKTLILETVRRTLAAPLPLGWEREILVIDDGSCDGTSQLLRETPFPPEVRVFNSIVNSGKGFALRVGFELATGDVLLVQDGDLEYDPVANFPTLLEPFSRPEVKVVYGSRFLACSYPKAMAFQNWCANKLLAWMVQLLYFARLTDEATANKVFRREVLSGISLECRRYEFCPEFTAKVLKKGYRIHEVPIQYSGRNHAQGKKIKFRDGLEAIFTLIKWRFRH